MEIFGKHAQILVFCCAGNSDNLEGFAVIKSIAAYEFYFFSKRDLIQIDASLEGSLSNVTRLGGDAYLFQLPAIYKGIFSDIEKRCRKVDAHKVSAFGKSFLADMGKGSGKFDPVQRGGPFLKGNFFAYLETGHVVLESKNAIADDFAAVFDGYFVGKIFGIQDLCPVRRIAETVVVVPNVPCELFF